MLVHVRFSSITMYQAIKQLYRTSGKLIIQCIEDNGFITCTKQINQATFTVPAVYCSFHLSTNNRVLSFFFFFVYASAAYASTWFYIYCLVVFTSF